MQRDASRGACGMQTKCENTQACPVMLCANDLVVAYESNPTTPLKQTGMRVYISPSTGDFSEVSPIDVGSADQETVSVTVDDTRPGSPLPSPPCPSRAAP